jgi:hypothetical protein
MKTIFYFVLSIGVVCSIFSCNSDAEKLVEPDDVSPDSLFFFSEQEVIKITGLVELIPFSVKSGFDERFLNWVSTWNEEQLGASSNPWDYAENDEYEDLLGFCKKYSKAVWPLLFDVQVRWKLITVFPENRIISILSDMTFEGDRYNIQATINSSITDMGLDYMEYHFKYGGLYVYYSKKLLAKEYDNILKAIQAISEIDNKSL